MTKATRRQLHPKVLDLLRQGKLPEFDCEWIAGLVKERQLAAAEKIVNGSLQMPTEGRVFKGKGTMRL